MPELREAEDGFAGRVRWRAPARWPSRESARHSRSFAPKDVILRLDHGKKWLDQFAMIEPIAMPGLMLAVGRRWMRCVARADALATRRGSWRLRLGKADAVFAV